ncbi:MAG: SDR family NAD(P)-dependent oxidoreductase [Deinococcales bacterium]
MTGASRGLGRALAGFLAAGGFDLVLTARGARALQQAADELPGEGRYRTLAGSVTNRDHVAALAHAAGERVDLLVHNASTLGPSPLPPLAQAHAEALRDVLETNVVAPLALTQALMPALTRAHGLVVAITSDAAVGAYPGWGVYGASKAALELLARTLAAELDTIDVVVVDPGDMRTDMHQRAFPSEDISDRPAPEVTLPFFAWLLSQPRESVNGRRFEAQSEAWTVAGPAE